MSHASPRPGPHATRAHRRGAAIGIIVLLIAFAIILYLMFGLSTGGGGSGGSSTGGGGYVGQAMNTRKAARQTAFSINTQQLSILIANYRQQNNKDPKTAEDMDAAGSFRDQWGHPMTFEIKDDAVTFRSAGPDGEMGNEDDITATDRLPF